MPGRLLKSHRSRLVILVFLAYWMLSPFTNAIYVAQAFSIVLFFIVGGVLYKYSRQVWESVVADDYGATSQLAQGIWLGFFGLGLGLAWAVLSRVVPDGGWMPRSHMVGFYLLCYIVAGTLHMTARRDGDGRIPIEDIRHVILAYALGALVAAVLLILELGRILRPL